jgi:hypothetical protein
VSIVQTRGSIMAEYARGICERLAQADDALKAAVAAADLDALLVGMGEREASLTATEDLVSELDLSGLSAAEHASIIRQMVQALERSQVAQAALESEMFKARREAARSLNQPMPRPRLMERSGYGLSLSRKVLGQAG